MRLSKLLRLDLLLGALDRARDHAVLDGDAFLHTELAHDVLDAVGPEDPHQVVLEGQVEPRRARVALAARTAAQLVVDPPRLVALGADDVEASGGDDLVPVGGADLPQLLQPPRVLLGVFDVLELVGRDGLGIAAEDDVGAAAGHVRRDRDGAGPARLGHDLGLLLVKLGVQDDVRDAASA